MQFLQKHWLALVTVVIGLVLVFGPHNLFHNCADAGVTVKTAMGMAMPMRCTWSVRAEQGVGALAILLGAVMMMGGFRTALRPLSWMALGLGLLTILNPLYIVPTCPDPKMICNLSVRPWLLLLGGLLTVAGLAGTLLTGRAATETRGRAT